MTQTQKERTRARILDEAAKALRTHGTDGVGVAELMKRAGLTHGGFYAHFANRDDLVAHAVDRMFQDSADMLARHMDQGDAAKGLAGLIDYYLSEEAWRNIDRGCPIPSMSGEATRMPSAARDRFTSGIAAFQTALERSLAALGAQSPRSLASSVLAELVGAMSLARAMSSDESGRIILRDCREELKRRIGV